MTDSRLLAGSWGRRPGWRPGPPPGRPRTGAPLPAHTRSAWWPRWRSLTRQQLDKHQALSHANIFVRTHTYTRAQCTQKCTYVFTHSCTVHANMHLHSCTSSINEQIILYFNLNIVPTVYAMHVYTSTCTVHRETYPASVYLCWKFTLVLNNVQDFSIYDTFWIESVLFKI